MSIWTSRCRQCQIGCQGIGSVNLFVELQVVSNWTSRCRYCQSGLQGVGSMKLGVMV